MPRKRKDSAQAAQWNQRQRLVEEFALLDREIDLIKPRVFRYEKLRRLILDWYPDLTPEQEATAPGITCDILISSRDKVRQVTEDGKKKLFKLWGPRSFIAKCLVHLKDLPDPKDDDGLYTVQALAGPRHLHVIAKGEPAAPAA